MTSFTASHPTAQIRPAVFHKYSLHGLRWNEIKISWFFFFTHRQKHRLILTLNMISLQVVFFPPLCLALAKTNVNTLVSLRKMAEMASFSKLYYTRRGVFNTSFDHSCSLTQRWSWQCEAELMDTCGGFMGTIEYTSTPPCSHLFLLN